MARLLHVPMRDDPVMDHVEDHDVATAADPRHRLEDLLAGRVDRSDIDVRSFLLDPPPTDAERARIERRRLIVRRGSLAGAGVVAILLVAPWPHGPGGGHESSPRHEAAGAAALDAGAGPGVGPGADPVALTGPGARTEPVRGVRLDTPTPTRRARNPKRSVRAPAPAAASAPAPAPASVPEPAPAPTPTPTSAPVPSTPSAPTRHAAAPGPDDAIVAPVS